MNKEFTLIENYQQDNRFLDAFHNFMSSVFPSVNFREWAEKGFWNDNYIPFSIIANGRIISNVCAALMKVVINGLEYNAVQFGGVGTLPEYRNIGLSKRLMDYVIEKLEPKTDFFFLYANESVLSFYPKFGFNKFDEFVFSKIVNPTFLNNDVRKLDVDDENDYSILCKLLNNRILLTKVFGAIEYQFITMWHIYNIYRDDLYYLEDENAIIIKQEKNNKLYIIDLICPEKFDIDAIIPKLIQSKIISKVKLFFPPDQLNYKNAEIEKETTELFIRGNITMPNEPFRFPLTAIT